MVEALTQYSEIHCYTPRGTCHFYSVQGVDCVLLRDQEDRIPVLTDSLAVLDVRSTTYQLKPLSDSE